MLKNRTVIVTGLTRIWAGITNIAKGLLDKKVSYIYYYQEHNNFYSKEDNKLYAVVYAPMQRLKNIIKFAVLLIRQKPTHLELYHHLSDSWLIIFHIIVAKILNVPILTICTGGEILYWEKHSAVKKFSVKFAFMTSEVVILKELYMKDYVHKYRIGSLEKCIIINNCIPLQTEPIYSREKHTVLFLNTFKPWRNINLVIDAAEIVLSRISTAKFFLVGLTGKNGEEEIQRIVRNKGLMSNINLLPFSKNPRKYFDIASIFLLPADVVFCNNALLEAMERGVPPIVSDVEGSELIVEHYVSGLIVKREAKELARAIILLLENNELRLQLAKGARKKIEKDFSEDRRSVLLYEIYTKKIWKNLD